MEPFENEKDTSSGENADTLIKETASSAFHGNVFLYVDDESAD